MSVQNLTSQNFQVVGRSRQTLNINLDGYVLVFFKMDGCTGCAAFEPQFYQLANAERGINYAVANLSSNREIIAMSRTTSTSIQTVPYIVLYVNGSPFAKYNGKKNVQALRSFIKKALSQAPASQSSFVPRQQPAPGAQPGMYGSGSYQHPQMAPAQGHAGYNQAQQPGKVWMPEMEKKPSMSGALRGGESQYAHLNDIDEEDEERLLLPGQVTPHNVPWESNYRKVGTID